MSLHLFAAATVTCLVYGCALALYRLFLHPLSRYPGPRLAILTDWYVLYYAWRGDLHKQVQQWHARYGKVVRYGPSTLSFNSATAMTEIYGVRANVRKTDGYAALGLSRRCPNSLVAIDKGLHGFKRRIMAQVFSEQNLKQMEERILDNVTDFVSLLGSDSEALRGWGPPKDVAQACTWMTFDIIADLCYGEDLNLLQVEDMRWFPSVFRKISQRGMMSLIQPRFIQMKLDHFLLASQYKAILRAGSWIRERGEARAKLGNKNIEKDIFSTMMNATDPKTGRNFTQKDLWVESMLLLVAGSDTTSNALSATIYYLLHHPTSLKHLTTELRSTFPTETSIRFDSASPTTSPYLHACVNEAMRLAPSVPNAPPRAVCPGGIYIDGDFIPAGTVVGAPIYTLHRNEAYFDRPDEFRPERWLDPSYSSNNNNNKSPGVSGPLAAEQHQQQGTSAATTTKQTQACQAFCPFSYGARSCVGWRLAYTELHLAVARLLWRYDVRLAAAAAPASTCSPNHGKTDSEYEMMGWVVAAVEGPVAQFRRREDLF
ncbi:cytochrome P450 [Aspergillus brunneoviolaceus CBS 621.78]|uniref:Cytochrome P450 monooxygenase n=1 Tax=Aspergillus brunneoviolaceus CBS 621.78 TaxID=1450534 RepID=A0ACD1G4L2_9EURO|nr:cytochrome P450 monooxygenase [Aspergillus brunneoviolaceus CBS 621.78]RAH44190.1 cytochrome P450 monooxygenase [Aspergillus brunneoviolaceus CBS 621.78]